MYSSGHALPDANRNRSLELDSINTDRDNICHRAVQLVKYLSSLEHASENSAIAGEIEGGKFSNHSVDPTDKKEKGDIIVLDSDDEDGSNSEYNKLASEVSKDLIPFEVTSNITERMVHASGDKNVLYNQGSALVNQLPWQKPSIQFERVVLQKRSEEQPMQDLVAATKRKGAPVTLGATKKAKVDESTSTRICAAARNRTAQEDARKKKTKEAENLLISKANKASMDLEKVQKELEETKVTLNSFRSQADSQRKHLEKIQLAATSAAEAYANAVTSCGATTTAFPKDGTTTGILKWMSNNFAKLPGILKSASDFGDRSAVTNESYGLEDYWKDFALAVIESKRV